MADSEAKRIMQVQIILTTIDKFMKNEFKDIPVILSGDFNDEPHSQPVQILEKDDRFTDLYAIAKKEMF